MIISIHDRLYYKKEQLSLEEALTLSEQADDNTTSLSITVTLDMVVRLANGKRLLLYTATSVNFEETKSANSTVNICKVQNFLF